MYTYVCAQTLTAYKDQIVQARQRMDSATSYAEKLLTGSCRCIYIYIYMFVYIHKPFETSRLRLAV